MTNHSAHRGPAYLIKVNNSSSLEKVQIISPERAGKSYLIEEVDTRDFYPYNAPL